MWIKHVAAAIGLAMIAGCAITPAAKSPSCDPAQYARGYADAWADREQAMRDAEAAIRANERTRIRQSEPFIAAIPMDTARYDEVSSLPRKPSFDQDIWWDSRKRNVELIQACRDTGLAKDALIHSMRDEVAR